MGRKIHYSESDKREAVAQVVRGYGVSRLLTFSSVSDPLAVTLNRRKSGALLSRVMIAPLPRPTSVISPVMEGKPLGPICHRLFRPTIATPCLAALLAKRPVKSIRYPHLESAHTAL